MGGLYLYTSPFETQKNSPFWQLLQSATQTHSNSTLLIVGSTAIKKNITTWLLNKNGDEKALPMSVTLDELLLLCTPDTGTITRHRFPEKFTLLNSLYQHQTPNGPFHTYPLLNSPTIAPSVLNELQQSIHYLETHQIDSNHPQLPQPLQTIYHHYRQLKSANPHAQSLLDIYTQEAKAQYPNIHKILADKTVFICGFWDVPPYQRDFLDTIIRTAPNSLLHLYTQDNNPIYSASTHWHTHLITQFPTCRAIHTDKAPTDPPVPRYEIHHYPTVTDTIEDIAKQIISLKEKHPDLPYHAIGIVMPHLRRDSAKITQLFQNHHIPIQPHRTPSLTQHPYTKFIADTLNLMTGSPSKDSLLNWISNPLFTHSHPSIYKTLLHLCHSDTLSLSGLIHQLTQHQTKPSPLEEQNDTQREIITLLTGLHNSRQHYPKTGSLSQWASRIQNWEATFQIKHRLQTLWSNYSESDWAPQAHGYAMIHHELNALQTTDTQYTHTQWKQLLRLLLHDCRLPPQHSVTDSVQLLGKFESFMVDIPILFMTQCTEGNWPTLPQSTPFISETDWNALQLPSPQQQYHTDAYLFHSLLHHSQTAIICTDSESHPLHSHFIHQFNHYWAQKTRSVTHDSPPKTHAAYLKQIPGEKALNPNILQSLLNTHTQSAFSATQFEQYQACPHAYWFNRILQLPDTPKTDADLLPSEWGSWVHRVVYNFQLALKKQNIPLNTAQSLAILQEIIQKTPAPEGEKWIIQLKRHRLEKIVEHWREEEINSDISLHPSLLEWEFGPEQFPITLHHQNKQMALKGKIDMVLSDDTRNNMIIVDYKTGSTLPDPGHIKTLVSLQLPIYHLALAQHFTDTTVHGGLLIQLRDPETIEKKIPLMTEYGLKDCLKEKRKRPITPTPEFFEQLVSHLFELQNHMQNAQFSFDPHIHPHTASQRSEKCRSCPHIFICRYPDRFKGR